MNSFCIHCGTQSFISAKFCHACGQKHVEVDLGPDLLNENSAKENKNSNVYAPNTPRVPYASFVNHSVVGFFLRYWRGDYPMPVVFILVGLMTFAVFAGLEKTLTLIDLGSDVRSSLSQGLIMMTSSVTFFLLPIFYWVGVVRSANYMVRERQNTAASIFCFLTCTLLITSFFIGSGPIRLIQLKEGIALIMYEPGTEAFDVSLTTKGVARFGGYIEFGAASQLAGFLAKNPELEYLELESPGGSVIEALAIARVIKSHQLSTFNDGVCSSACTIAFVAGNEQ